MLTQAPPIFKTMFRQAEHSDARLEIRRDEKHEHRGKRHDAPEEEADNALWEDSNVVSVEALKAFLIGFLKEKGEFYIGQGDIPPQNAPLSPSEDEKSAQTYNPIAAKAAKAYAATAAHTQDHSLESAPQSLSAPESQTAPADTLASEEIRTIHAVIQDLSLLEKHNVQTLTILKAETFLEAILAAVQLEKQSLNL